MKHVLSASAMRALDQFTIEHDHITSVDLMERASLAVVRAIFERFAPSQTFRVFCGPGNNGGDGLAIARLLADRGANVFAYALSASDGCSAEMLTNLERLKESHPSVFHEVNALSDLPYGDSREIWVDAIFGSGMNRPVSGIYQDWITHINASGSFILSIDLPSGMDADRPVAYEVQTVMANWTLTFQCPKLSFFFPGNVDRLGEWRVLEIGLNLSGIDTNLSKGFMLEDPDIRLVFRPRRKSSHKGTHGHALLIAGSKGKSGAALMAARACLRSGVGLLTVHVPGCAHDVMQLGAPEAMLVVDEFKDHITPMSADFEHYTALGIGPGIGKHQDTAILLNEVIRSGRLTVIDADALNILSSRPDALDALPAQVILTPHPKEFERLTRPAIDDADRLELARQFAVGRRVVLVLKGSNTVIASPDGSLYFNTTGNAGLARGGSGDILTGMMLAFLAQGYDPLSTALLAVFAHGKAADYVASRSSMQGMLPSDVVEALPAVFSSWER